MAPPFRRLPAHSQAEQLSALCDGRFLFDYTSCFIASDPLLFLMWLRANHSREHSLRGGCEHTILSNLRQLALVN